MFGRFFAVYPLLAGLAAFAIASVLLPDVEWPRLAALALVTVIAAVLPAFAVTRWFVGPVRALTDGMRQAGEVGPGLKVYAGGFGLFGPLVRAFNAMSEKLSERVARLEDDRQQLRAVLSGMVEGVVALDAGQRILFANARAAQLLEFPQQSAIGRRFWEVVRQRPIQE